MSAIIFSGCSALHKFYRKHSHLPGGFFADEFEQIVYCGPCHFFDGLGNGGNQVRSSVHLPQAVVTDELNIFRHADVQVAQQIQHNQGQVRSEERRVGKECRL